MNEQRCHDIDSYFLPGKWGYHRQGSCQAGLGASVADVSIILHSYPDQGHSRSRCRTESSCSSGRWARGTGKVRRRSLISS